jgi:hypothetical protein
MSREMTDLMTRGSRRDPTLTPLQKAMYSGRMMSLQRRGIDRGAAMLRPSEGFKYWTDHIIMRVARHFDSVIIITGEVGCHAKGQGILMFDGSIKKVEDIAVNDCLMGPDSTPRFVKKLYRGRSPMRRIVPNRGTPFTVSQNHVLTLRRQDSFLPDGKLTVDVPLPLYETATESQRDCYKLFTVGVEFPRQANLPMNPYIVGAWLGDGTKGSGVFSITSADEEMLVEITRWAHSIGCVVHTRPNKLSPKCLYISVVKSTRIGRVPSEAQRQLRSIGLNTYRCETLRIPSQYLTASHSDRMELLAGLLDTDGYVVNGSASYCSKSDGLANDVAFLARSLGFAANVYQIKKKCQTGAEGWYSNTSIVGDISAIPLRLSRKKIRLNGARTFFAENGGVPGREWKCPTHTGFRVELCEEDDFYGFELDGDGRYLLDTFVVTHNSGKSTMCLRLAQAFEPGFDVSRLCYSASDLLEAYETVQPGQSVIFDESVRGLQAGDQSTREQKALIQALVLVREKGAILMLCVPDIFLIAKQIRQKRATLWIHVMERGVALVHERNSYLRYQPDNTLGFTRSRSVPLLEWKPFKTTDKLWIAYQELKRRRLDEYLHETKELLSGKKKGPQPGETKKEYNARRQRERRERMNGGTSEPAENHDADSTALEDEPKGKNRMQKALEQAAKQPPEVETE